MLLRHEMARRLAPCSNRRLRTQGRDNSPRASEWKAGGQAAEFRYLLPDDEDDGGFEL